MELFQYSESVSWLHEVNPLVKIAFVLSYSFILFITWNPLKLALLFSFITLLVISLKPSYNVMAPYIKISILFSVSAIMSQGLFYYDYYYAGRGEVIFYLLPPNLPIIGLITMGKGIALILDGLVYGLFVSLKAVGLLFASLILVLSTKPGDILSSLTRIKIPVRLAAATMIALRFVPLLIEEIFVSSKIVSFKGEKISLIRLPSYLFLVLKVVVLNAYRKAFSIAVSLKLRGIDRLSSLPLEDIHIGLADFLLAISVLLSILIAFF